VFFKRYRNTTLVDHLGNLFGSIRIQKHHLIETKRPRTPLKLSHLRYRIRDLRELRVILKFDFKLTKDPYKRKSGGIYKPSTLHTTRPNQPKGKTKLKNKPKLIHPLAKTNLKRFHLHSTPHGIIDLQIEVSRYKAPKYNQIRP